MKTRLICAAIVLVIANGAQAQEVMIAKQLAGAPEEFAAMQPVDPVTAAIRSKSALVPVSTTIGADGKYRWQANLAVDSERARVLLLKPNDNNWQMSLGSASRGSEALSLADQATRQMSRAETIASVHTQTTFGMQSVQVPAELFAFESLSKGKVAFDISSNDNKASNGFLLLEGDSNTLLISYQTASNQRLNRPVSITAALQNFAKSANSTKIDTAVLNVTAPSGAQSQTAFFDDGQHNDGVAGDGLFGATFVPSEIGDYKAQARVEGSAGGVEVLRTAEHLIPVINDELNFSRGVVQLADAKTPGRLAISVPMSSNKAGQHYRAYAQLWGRDSSGKEVAIAWLGGMVTPANGVAELEFDARWIALAGANAPYSLRAVRFEDPDHFITLAQAAELAISDRTAPIAANKSVQIDEAMTMGLRPVQAAVQAKGVGTRLLLVHGYCSGNVWTASSFANASVFLDLNQNRSNDAFAQRIKTFGSTWNSYGIVAHSQGGMASLHLYNYYWSGLDNAVGSRLIQSVGTPYKGTNLAGVLAALGGIFGVGCGTNTDLTYTGAANWLAGISTASRAKVNFHTTSFQLTNWWTNDFCNFASDLVLGDPEDGTTEQANGQLSGGVNRGHVTGQCHTDGMRDPAQVRDASRNSTMSANAAR